MLTLLSPAKSLDFETRPATRKHSEPRLVAESEQLVAIMREKSPAQISTLMSISEDLATLNAQRYTEDAAPGNSGSPWVNLCSCSPRQCWLAGG